MKFHVSHTTEQTSQQCYCLIREFRFWSVENKFYISEKQCTWIAKNNHSVSMTRILHNLVELCQFDLSRKYWCDFFPNTCFTSKGSFSRQFETEFLVFVLLNSSMVITLNSSAHKCPELSLFSRLFWNFSHMCETEIELAEL